jgi:hypothetical protein
LSILALRDKNRGDFYLNRIRGYESKYIELESTGFPEILKAKYILIIALFIINMGNIVLIAKHIIK